MYMTFVVWSVIVYASVATEEIESSETFPCEGDYGQPLDIDCMKKQQDELFQDISRQQIELEDTLHRFCLRTLDVQLRNVVQTDRYKLSCKLSGFSEEDFDIKINSSVLFLTARKPNKFAAKLAILPQFVDTKRASYFYEDDTINIVFPINSATDVCDRGFKSDVITVPKFEVVWGEANSTASDNVVDDSKNNTRFQKLLMFEENTNVSLMQEKFPCRNESFYLPGCTELWNGRFNQLSSQQILLENKLRNACFWRSNGRLREVVEIDKAGRYKLTTKLSGYSEDEFEIKIQSSVLYFSVRNSHAFNAQTVIIPRFVNVTKASYSYYNNTLDITFPIKTKSGVCSRSFRKLLQTVPASVSRSHGEDAVPFDIRSAT